MSRRGRSAELGTINSALKGDAKAKNALVKFPEKEGIQDILKFCDEIDRTIAF